MMEVTIQLYKTTFNVIESVPSCTWQVVFDVVLFEEAVHMWGTQHLRVSGRKLSREKVARVRVCVVRPCVDGCGVA